MLNNHEYIQRKTIKRVLIKENLAKERGSLCLDCNKTFEPGLFDFHHRDPEQKDFTISRALKYDNMSRFDSIKAEAAKCDMLCPVCHRRRHYYNIKPPTRPKDKTRLKYKTMMVKAFGGRCWSCSNEFEYFNFDFHHLDDDKKEFSLSSAMVKCLQLSKLIEEAKKCAMLCAICHRKLHQYNNVQIHNIDIDFSVFSKPEVSDASYCKTCGIKITKGSSFCASHISAARRKVVDRPSKEHLLQLLSQNSCVKVGKLYGVSDKCIKKWLS